MFEPTVSRGVLRVAAPGARWLSSGWAGGFHDAAAAYNVCVPEGWGHTDLDAYVESRRTAAGFDDPGPTLLTGVDLAHAVGASGGSVTAYATAGVSNPAALPMDDPDPRATSGSEPARAEDLGPEDGTDEAVPGEETDDPGPGDGTVNVLVGTTRALDDGALANLLAVVAEAKAATLLAEAGFPGTTTDAVVVGCDPAGEAAAFSGSATPVGAAARACVRDAVRGSLRSRYADRSLPDSVGEAEHGVVTGVTTEVFEP